MKKPIKISKFAPLIAVAATILAVCMLLFMQYGQSIGFTAYKPTSLPAGLRTTHGELYILRKKGLIPSYDKHINIYIDAKNSWIAEWKSNGRLTNPCADFPNETNCRIYKTPGGQQYQLKSTISPTSDHYSYDVRFIKQNTEIWITIPDLKQNISTSAWGSAIDSFQATRYNGLKIIHGSASGP